MIGGLVLIAMAIVSVVAFVDIQRYMADPLRKEKKEEWFARFLEHNKDSFNDPELAWRYNVIEDSFDGG